MTRTRGATTGRNGRKPPSPIAAAATLAARAVIGAVSADEVVAFIDKGLADRADRSGHRWFTYDASYRAWAGLAAEAAIDVRAPAAVLDRLAGFCAATTARRRTRVVAGTGRHAHPRQATTAGRAADLCTRAARGAQTGTYPALDRLDLIARAADIAATVAPDLGRELFGQAVDVATGINDDAARLLAVHADLASRAAIPPMRIAPVSRAVSSGPSRPSHRMSPMPGSSPTRKSPVPPPGCTRQPGSPQRAAGTTRTEYACHRRCQTR